MENNIICNWLLYYSFPDPEIISSEIITDIQCTPSTKVQLCSASAYFNCGQILFDDFPSNSSGFIGLFEYLSESQWKVMDKMHKEEQRLYIDKLEDYDDFSIKHHTSIIKCLMKSYACYLAPLDRIKRALEALGVVTSLEDAKYISNYRQLHKNLTIWLKEAAKKGIQRILKFNKDAPDLRISNIVDKSCLGSLILYTMMYYTQTKMINYKVTLPEVESPSNHVSTPFDISLNHSSIVITAFTDICGNKDILPLQINGLLSKSLDNVPTSLTIALIFHWTFGNSLRNLENLLKSSASSSKLNDWDKIPNQRPSHLLLNNTSKDPQDYKAFYMNSKTSTDYNHPIMNKEKEGRGRKHINGSISSSKNGGLSPDIFHTSTDDEMSKTFAPPIKLLSSKSIENASNITTNNQRSDPISVNLKSQFQTKLLQKQYLIKQNPNVNTTLNSETTWLAQSNKNDIVPIPLTPKKNVKQTEIKVSSDSQQNLTQGQIQEIHVQLSLRRKKIEHGKKDIVQQTEKTLESSKQKVFFQALNKNNAIVRHKSLELLEGNSSKDICCADKRLSMYILRTEKGESTSNIKRLFSHPSPSKDIKEITQNGDVNLTPASESKVQDLVHPQSLVLVEDKSQSLIVDQARKEDNIPNEDILSSTIKDTSTIPHPGEPSDSNPLNSVSLSRQNSSPSISNLSSLSNISTDNNLVTKDEYQKSIDLLSNSLISLQEELRILRSCNQKQSWNRQISETKNKITEIAEVFKVKSENNSVVDTPTNTIIPLTETVDLPQNVVQSGFTNKEGHHHREEATPMTVICNSKVSDIDSPKECYVPVLDPSHKVFQIPESKSSQENHKVLSVSDNSEVLTASLSESEKNDMTSSSVSAVISSVQPLSFVIIDDQNTSDAVSKKAELLAKREQRRLMKLEMFKQRREQERENQITAANEELLERELKKRIEQEKRDSLFQKYLDRKNEEKVSVPVSVSSTNTSLKSANKSQTTRLNMKSSKQDSVESLTLSPKRNNWFSSMRQTHRVTSSSTSVLNSNVSLGDNLKTGVPLPPQEYIGPKLFGKRKVKTNRSVISNAISYCCLAGSVNVHIKDIVLKELADAEGTHFMILFRDARCQYRSLYIFDLVTEDLNIITGNGPKRITHEMVEKFFKYNSGGKQFNPILSTKHLSTAVDAICIKSIHWNTRPTSQILSGAVSSLSLPRPRRL